MLDVRKIHVFACKWISKLCKKNINFAELISKEMDQELNELEIKADGGLAFCKEYGKRTFDKVDTLRKMIDEVEDISLLASAIYSKCICFGKLKEEDAKEQEDEYRKWFLATLQKLQRLAHQKAYMFKGPIKEISITSYNEDKYMTFISYEVDQTITINENGEGSFITHNLNSEWKETKVGRKKKLKIKKEIVKKIFEMITSSFENKISKGKTTCIKNGWAIKITNDAGNEFLFEGPFFTPEIGFEFLELSELLRDALKIDNLFALDRNPVLINKISIDYNRRDEDESGEEAKNVDVDIENLTVDRIEGSIEYTRTNDSGDKEYHKYVMPEDIKSLFNKIYEEKLYQNFEESLENVIKDKDKDKSYKITVEYKNKILRTIEGDYDKYGLPYEFNFFIDEIYYLMSRDIIGEIFSTTFYAKKRRGKGEYIFCSVRFDGGFKNYYYLTDDESIEAGDHVIVPVGNDAHHVEVTVIDVDYFKKEDAPMPINKVKKIIRKCD